MPTPFLVSRASARVSPSSSCSETSTGQLSTIVMAAHLLPDAGATMLRLAVTPPSSARRGSQVKGLMSPPPGEFLLPGRPRPDPGLKVCARSGSPAGRPPHPPCGRRPGADRELFGDLESVALVKRAVARARSLPG